MNKPKLNLQHHAGGTILDLFSHKEVLTYLRNRELPKMLGDELFPARKTQSLELDQITGGGGLPVSATVHAFDTESEIGSRQAAKQTLELALIKRKLQLKEKDIIALENPRNADEQRYLTEVVYNDIDNLVKGVMARIERMRMEVLANGVVTTNENGLTASVDYQVPANHKEALAGANQWTDPTSDPLGDIQRWIEAMDVTPTRALTSRKVLNALLRHPQIKASVFGSDTGKVLTQAELDSFLQANGLPVIRTYDAKYKEQQKDGSYTTKRYFPENKFVMFDDAILGETVFGPTAEERLVRRANIDTSLIGNVLAMVYEENLDPVGTWEKAVATALPSFAAADEVFQAQPIA